MPHAPCLQRLQKRRGNVGMARTFNSKSQSHGQTTMQSHNPKLDPAPGSNTEKPPEEWVSGDESMTGEQASYLTTLCEEAKVEPPSGHLTKAEASKLIDELKAQLGR